MDTKRCIVCGVPANQGLEICGKHICSACEQRIVSSAVNDQNYPDLIERLKKLWEGMVVKA